jgi:hypothetical protein
MSYTPPPLQTRLQVYWPEDDKWYSCKLSKQLEDGRVELKYDDGDVEVLELEKEIWLPEESHSQDQDQQNNNPG